MKYIPATIFVTFCDIADEEIESCLQSHDLFGTRVSAVGNRWAIEVPVGKEQDFIKKFAGKDIVSKVSESCIPGYVKVNKRKDDREERKEKKEYKETKEVKPVKQSQPQKKLRGGI